MYMSGFHFWPTCSNISATRLLRPQKPTISNLREHKVKTFPGRGKPLPTRPTPQNQCAFNHSPFHHFVQEVNDILYHRRAIIMLLSRVLTRLYGGGAAGPPAAPLFTHFAPPIELWNSTCTTISLSVFPAG